jgi:hypothetical protein
MVAKPQLIAKAFSHHAGCAALAIKKKIYIYIGELLHLGHFITRAKDNKSEIKQSPWLDGLDTHQSPDFQGFNPH